MQIRGHERGLAKRLRYRKPAIPVAQGFRACEKTRWLRPEMRRDFEASRANS
jgi:hypothetical protein